jgi:hypothetical protein
VTMGIAGEGYRVSAKPESDVVEYVQHRTSCPYCGKRDIRPDYDKVKGPLMTVVPMFCRDCQSRWMQEALWIVQGQRSRAVPALYFGAAFFAGGAVKVLLDLLW